MNDSDSSPDASQAYAVIFNCISTPREVLCAHPQGFVLLPRYIC